MDELLLHPQTLEALTAFLANPKHSLVIAAAEGSGKSTLAANITSKLLEVETASLNTRPGYRLIKSEGKSVPIEAVRELKKFLSLKTLGTNRVRRVAVIENADTMTTEAQNAMLKILEEPPLDTVIIMTASDQEALLPTIRSRVTTLSVQSPRLDQVLAYFKQQGYEDAMVQRIFRISSGRVGLISSMLKTGESHPLSQAIAQSKMLLSKPLFERLLQIEPLLQQKDALGDLLYAMERVSLSALAQASNKGDVSATKRWLEVCKQVRSARQAFKASAQPKLLLTNLLLNI